MYPSVYTKTLSSLNNAREKNDTCILFFSATGKDSIVLLHLLKDRFKTVVCCFLYIVDNLSFIENYLNWAKTFQNVIIEKYPHPILYNYKASGYFSTKAVKGIKKVSFNDIADILKKKYNTEVVIYGHKVSDSYIRRGMFAGAAKNEFHTQYNKYYPIVNWKNKDCIDYITLNKLPRPLKLGSKRPSSGVSFRKETILFIKEHYPQDYKKMCYEFNLLEVKYGKAE